MAALAGLGLLTSFLTACQLPLAGVVAVSAGSLHTCAVLTDGKVQCWGLNDQGQLGDGTTASSTGPVEVLGLGDIVEVSAGFDHTCARNGYGAMWCWGDNSEGQLGNGTFTDSSRPVSVSLGLGSVATISTGRHNTCAIYGAHLGSPLFCWGSNDAGQVGDNSFTDRSTPRAVIGMSGTELVSVGNQTVCAIAGAAQCWGSNTRGEFGNATFTSSAVPVLAGRYAGSFAYSYSLITVGNGHVCGVDVTLGLLCWGRNNAGQLGDGTTGVDQNTPQFVDLNGATIFSTTTGWISSLAAGSDFTCAQNNTAHVACWGNNYQGQFGNGGTASSAQAIDVPALDGVGTIDPGDSHQCVVDGATGEARCWGWNAAYQLGDNSIVSRPSPVSAYREQLLGFVGSTAGGYFHTCAIVDGGVQCFGYNGFGQLGDGTTVNRPHPTPVPAIPTGLNGATKVVAGAQHSCALMADQTVRCWGLNDSGQLGDSTTTNRTTPVSVSGLTDAIDLAAGSNFNCAVRSAGTVVCWGNDGQGQLGNGEPRTNSAVPVNVLSMSGAAAITAGERHVCVRHTAGDVDCWGNNNHGQLGIDPAFSPGSYEPRPYLFAAGLTASQISAGADHTCAVAVGGGIQCWGRNDYGQIGNGSTTDVPVPTAVLNSSSYTFVDAGAYHSCALLPSTTDNYVACWGANYSGQIGDGTTINRPAPVGVPWQTTVTGIDAGGSHTCVTVAGTATTSDTAKCWGRGEYGQLGNGTTTASVPLPAGVQTTGSRWVPPIDPLH